MIQKHLEYGWCRLFSQIVKGEYMKPTQTGGWWYRGGSWNSPQVWGTMCSREGVCGRLTNIGHFGVKWTQNYSFVRKS